MSQCSGPPLEGGFYKIRMSSKTISPSQGGFVFLRIQKQAPAHGTSSPSDYNTPVRILISAGEASGEMYGAQLIQALRRLDPSLEFFGVGGERMRAAGCDTVVDAKDLAVVGISEILSHLPKIYGLFNHLIAEADRRRPDLAIVIDSPAFNWRVARQMHKRGIPVVYYVCPQFWAWRQGRGQASPQICHQGAGDLSLRGAVLPRARRGRDFRRTSPRRPSFPHGRARRLRPPEPTGCVEALDHPHAGQPGERSPHEPAHDS